jgi:transcriptional regulator with XRE-family HTH domain
MQNRFPELLNGLRERNGLSNRELAKRAHVPESLISGLQLGSRRVGETNARQLGEALGLDGDRLEGFVLEAINTSTRKVMRKAVKYPSALLNMMAFQLHRAGVLPDLVTDFVFGGKDSDQITLLLNDGRKANIEATLTLT